MTRTLIPALALCASMFAIAVSPASAQTTVVNTEDAQPAQPSQTVVVNNDDDASASQTRTTRGLNWGLVSPGVSMLISGWVGNAIVGTIGALDLGLDDDQNGSSDAARLNLGVSFLPIVGPFINAGIWADRPPEWRGEEIYMAMHLIAGIVQSGGLVLCILGTVLSGESETTTTVSFGGKNDSPQLSVLPYAGAEGAGVASSLRF